MRQVRWKSYEISRPGARLLLFALLAVVALRTILNAIVNPLWFDEICTVLVSRMGSAAAIWSALKDCVDSNPPGFYLAEGAAHQLVGNSALGWRILPVGGLLVAVGLIYLILASRVSRLSALAATAFLLCTPLMDFGADARPYALLMGCTACAIAAWQRIDDSPLWALALAAACATAISLHYYAVFVWPAFAVAELVVCIVSRRFRGFVWLAFAAGAAPLAFYLPHLSRLRAYFGQNFWARPELELLFHAHDWLFNTSGHWGFDFALILTAVLLFRAVTHAERTNSAGRTAIRIDGVPLEEIVLALMLLWVPAVALIVAELGHGGLTEQYMLPAVLGGALAFGYLLDKVPVAFRWLLIAVFLLNFSFTFRPILSGMLQNGLHSPHEGAGEEIGELAAEAHAGNLPIVIADGLNYLPLAFYADPADFSRIYTIADPDAAVAYTARRADTADRTLIALRRHVPLQVEDYAAFLAAHRTFILIAGENRDIEWLPQRLAHEGYAVDLISTSLDRTIYRVSARP